MKDKQHSAADPSLDRRSFLMRVGATLIAVPAVLSVTACSKNSDSASGPGSDPESWNVSNNDNSGHSHSFTVRCTQVQDGSAVVYQSTAAYDGHRHQITVSASDFQTIAQGGEAEINTTDLHAHTWRVSQPGSVSC